MTQTQTNQSSQDCSMRRWRRGARATWLHRWQRISGSRCFPRACCHSRSKPETPWLVAVACARGRRPPHVNGLVLEQVLRQVPQQARDPPVHDLASRIVHGLLHDPMRQPSWHPVQHPVRELMLVPMLVLTCELTPARQLL